MLFGVAMLGHGFAKDWQTLAGLRVPLGAFEGFLFPGSIFLISSWYPRYDTQKRISAFYLSGASFVSVRLGRSPIWIISLTERLYGCCSLGSRTSSLTAS